MLPLNTQHLGATCSDWLLAGTERVEDYVLKTERRFRTTMQFPPEQFALRQGTWRAKLAADRAWWEVPACRHFLAINGVKRPGGIFAASFARLKLLGTPTLGSSILARQILSGGSLLLHFSRGRDRYPRRK